MRFSLEVGEAEKTVVEVSFDPSSGRTTVLDNGHELFHHDCVIASIKSETMRFTVGTAERWDVRLEKQAVLFGTPRWRVFVGGRLARVF
jgi:hypothetical protein